MIEVVRAISWQAPLRQIILDISPVFVILFVIAGAIYALWALRQEIDAIPIAVLACGALAVFSYAEWWVTFVNATRVNVPIFFLTGVLWARRKDIVGRCLLVLAALFLAAMTVRIVTGATGDYTLISSGRPVP